MDDETILVLMNDASRMQSAYVSDILDLSGFASPQLAFESHLETSNTAAPVIARIFASTDGGKTFPHLIWRQGAIPVGQREVVRESPRHVLAHQSTVVLKFVFYGDRYWEIGNSRIVEAETHSQPVRDLVVKPAEDMTLIWKRSDLPDPEYLVYAAASTTDTYVPIAQTTDTIFRDIDWANFPQRFYRVFEQSRRVQAEPPFENRNVNSRRIERSYHQRD
ncbi:MAG: hypothetical protein IPG71_12680 [bacterium]|nr:hypothetical protein [bacterium]